MYLQMNFLDSQKNIETKIIDFKVKARNKPHNTYTHTYILFAESFSIL